MRSGSSLVYLANWEIYEETKREKKIKLFKHLIEYEIDGNKIYEITNWCSHNDISLGNPYFKILRL